MLMQELQVRRKRLLVHIRRLLLLQLLLLCTSGRLCLNRALLLSELLLTQIAERTRSLEPSLKTLQPKPCAKLT